MVHRLHAHSSLPTPITISIFQSLSHRVAASPRSPSPRFFLARMGLLERSMPFQIVMGHAELLRPWTGLHGRCLAEYGEDERGDEGYAFEDGCQSGEAGDYDGEIGFERYCGVVSCDFGLIRERGCE